MRKKTLKMAKLIAGASLLLFSVSTNALGNESLKDTLVIAQRSDAKTLDPSKCIDTVSSKVINLMFESLLSLDENMELMPGLAEKWEHLDDLNTVFHLKKGVKFHNGETMTAEDVVFSLNRARVSPQTGYYFKPITNVEALDEYTVKVTTDAPFGPLLKNLGQRPGSIVSKKAVEQYGDEFFKNPVGTGQYKFVKWVPGDKIEVEAFQDYHDNVAKNKKVVVRNIPEVSNRMIALETGEADVAFDIGMMDKDAVREHKKLEYMEVESPSVYYLGFDSTNPMFQNIKLRQAIAYAVDNEVLAEAVFSGSASPGDSAMPATASGYNPEVKKYDRDIEKAKQLMAEAGYKDGLKMELWVNQESSRVDMCTIIQDQVRDIGIDMEIKIWEWGSYVTRTGQPNKQLYLLSWNSSSGDGDSILYPLFHSSEHGASGNRSYYSNSDVDKFLMDARNSIDQDKRKDLYRKAQQIIQEELPHYTLVYPKLNMGIRKAVKNIVLKKNGEINVKNVYVTKK